MRVPSAAASRSSMCSGTPAARSKTMIRLITRAPTTPATNARPEFTMRLLSCVRSALLRFILLPWRGDVDSVSCWRGARARAEEPIMQPMTAEQATSFLGIYAGTLRHESQTTRSVLEAVPADRSDYRPDPFAKTAMELVRHIAIADNRFVETVTTGRVRHEPRDSRQREDARRDRRMVLGSTRHQSRRARPGDARAAPRDDRLPRSVHAAGDHVPDARTPPHDPPPRPLSSYLRSMGGKVPASTVRATTAPRRSGRQRSDACDGRRLSANPNLK